MAFFLTRHSTILAKNPSYSSYSSSSSAVIITLHIRQPIRCYWWLNLIENMTSCKPSTIFQCLIVPVATQLLIILSTRFEKQHWHLRETHQVLIWCHCHSPWKRFTENGSTAKALQSPGSQEHLSRASILNICPLVGANTPADISWQSLALQNTISCLPAGVCNNSSTLPVNRGEGEDLLNRQCQHPGQ